MSLQLCYSVTEIATLDESCPRHHSPFSSVATIILFNKLCPDIIGLKAKLHDTICLYS